ncbi:MAG: GNAT family N-acetyltransferase [Chloroflexi bacterium]|nr:GNAT family N-acetyltransferase [Chloroflexota bacterium]
MTGEKTHISVRPATVDDAPAIASLHIRAWQWAYRGQLPDAFLDDLSTALVRREQQWMQWLSQPGASFTSVAALDDRPVGFVHAGKARDADLEPHTGEVYSIYLDSAVVGQGVGRRLMSTAIAELSARGFQTAVLWVLESNQRARRFYIAAGWAPDGKRQPLELDGTTVFEVRYRRRLSLA